MPAAPLPTMRSRALRVPGIDPGRAAFAESLRCALDHRARWTAAWLLVLIAGCGVTEGALLTSVDAGRPPLDAPHSPEPTAPDGDASAGAARIRPGQRLHYQVSGTPSIEVAADVFVLDLFDAEPAQLDAARAAGGVTVAYFSAGSFEPWRPDADAFPVDAIGARLTDYPNERWLDPNSRQVRAIMRARLERARDKGFEAVFPGALDAYLASSGFALSATDQRDYARFLSAEARRLGLSPGLSGGFASARDLAPDFDFAIDVGCLAADSCERLRPLLDRGQAVFDLEVSGELAELCPRAEAFGIALALKRPSFDAWSEFCP